MIFTFYCLISYDIDRAKRKLHGILAVLINFITIEIVTINLIFIVLNYFSIKIY